MNNANNTTPYLPATYSSSGTHQFRKGMLFWMAFELVGAVACGVYSAARNALKR